MKNHLLLYVTLAFSGVTVASCVDETTEPSTAPVSAGPELAVTSNSWLIRRDMRYDRYDLSAAVVPNAAGQSILYAIGGRSGTTGLALGRVQAYNVATNTWAWAADMPIPAYMMNGAGVINGKIYVSGGFPPVGPRLPGSRLYAYDPAAGTWTRKSDMPASGFGGVTRVINGKLYVLTTCVLDNELHDFCPRSMFFRYDRIADKWAVLPRPSRAYEAGVVIAGKLYVAGSEQDKFDPVTNRVIRGASRVIRGASHLEVYDPRDQSVDQESVAPNFSRYRPGWGSIEWKVLHHWWSPRHRPGRWLGNDPHHAGL